MTEGRPRADDSPPFPALSSVSGSFNSETEEAAGRFAGSANSALPCRHWAAAIRVAALDCAEEKNHEVCRAYEIHFYPTFRYFKAFAKDFTAGEDFKGPDREPQTVRHTMIDFLQSHTDEGRPPGCPSLNPIRPRDVLSLIDNSGGRYVAVLFESNSSYVGREVILDLIPYENIEVKRALGWDKAFLQKLGVSSVPSCYLIYPNGSHGLVTVGKPLRSFFSSYLKSLPDVRKKSLSLPEKPSKEDSSEAVVWREFDRSKLYAADLESGLHHLLRVELAARRSLAGAELKTLKDFVTVLAKVHGLLLTLRLQRSEPSRCPRPLRASRLPVHVRTGVLLRTCLAVFVPVPVPCRAGGLHTWAEPLFPGRPPVRKLLETLQEWLASLPLDRIPYDAVLDLVNNKMRISGIFLTNHIKWVGCQGSRPELRGYTCSLWQLFHTLTVRAGTHPEALDGTGFEDDPQAVLQTIRRYVHVFFGCKECGEHFEEMAKESMDSVKTPDQAILWLWKKHNVVNSRLAADRCGSSHVAAAPPVGRVCPSPTAAGEGTSAVALVQTAPRPGCQPARPLRGRVVTPSRQRSAPEQPARLRPGCRVRAPPCAPRDAAPERRVWSCGSLDPACPPSALGPASGLSVEVRAVLRRTHSGISSRLGL
ncbi:hypothetical protein J1605_017263 [Eschrichtius robustus]|uniref:Sulfhydryl oxidase n=1 Tax=Eschrichtius robustus TaxID=9764 RepID=A0AB34HXI8_ESCRO|nr:hypothetical protein J1605_017263 [Eschrichtius robustus]